MTHTKEPWEISHDSHDGWPLVMAGGKIIANVNLESFSVGVADLIEMPAEDNARRIVACVNACSGIPNEVLELDQPQFVAILKQRSELLTICRNVVERGIGASDVKAMREIIEKAGAGTTATEGHNA